MGKLKYLYITLLFYFVFSDILSAQDGLVRSYYPNNHMELAIYYANDVLHGTARWFYENGVLKEEKNYSMGKLNGWIKTFYENSAPKQEVFIKDGKRDGIAREYYDNGGLKAVLVYSEGILKEKREYQYDSTLQPPAPEGKTNDFLMKGYAAKKEKELTSAEKVILEKSGLGTGGEFLTVVEEYPKPIGGLEAIQSRIIPPGNVKEKLKGVVVVRAYIDDHGYVTKTEVAKGLGAGYDEAAAEAVRKTTFQPGKQDGKPVNVQVTIPVSF